MVTADGAITSDNTERIGCANSREMKPSQKKIIKSFFGGACFLLIIIIKMIFNRT